MPSQPVSSPHLADSAERLPDAVGQVRRCPLDGKLAPIMTILAPCVCQRVFDDHGGRLLADHDARRLRVASDQLGACP